MKAVIYHKFKKHPVLEVVPDPKPSTDGVVIKVKATGLCRSDWHGWMGNDPDISLPHVPGHELAGIIVEVGKNVRKWKKEDRVTLPFVCGCGACPPCEFGNQQICDNQFQPGFTHWGSFAEYVAIQYADINLVRLPQEIEFETAASLGCRFITSFRALVDQGQVKEGQWVAVHGCGGVGLSAIMIAKAFRAKVIAIDITKEKLNFAQALGADVVINSENTNNVVDQILDLTNGGVHISLDALGHPQTCYNSIANLRKQGKHIQIGIMETQHKQPSIPIDKIIAHELEIIGSHGMQAHRYPQMLQMIQAGKLSPQKLIGRIISLEESIEALMNLNNSLETGITVINEF